MGAFDYDFGAVENSDNKLTKSYNNMRCRSLPLFNIEATITMGFHSFAAFGRPSKVFLFMVDSLRWAPRGFATWVFERDQRPGMVNLRENKKYAHEVATKLIEEKRQELKNGTSGRDLLSLLGSS